MSTVAELGEDRLVESVVARLGAASAADTGPMSVQVGPGDDAAAVAVAGTVVLSTDTLVQDVDFRLDWSSGHDVGVKAAVQAFADVEAMGAVPTGLLASLTVPGVTPVDWCLGLADGLAAECSRAGAVVLGGDVADGPVLVVTGTAVGVLPSGVTPVVRSGARPGDVLALAGRTGASAAGLALLQAGRHAEPGGAAEHVLGVHRAPTVDHGAGRRAALGGATALIDVSDGLVRDARRIADASGAQLDLDPGALEPGREVRAVADLLGADAFAWVLTSGEEHALLGSFPDGTRLPDGFRSVGTVQAGGPGVSVAGTPWEGPGGWTHYDRRP